jgi:large subunit ribosomal protein L5
MSENKHVSVKEKLSEAQSKFATEFSIKNKMALPTIKKVVVNAGTGQELKHKDIMAKLVGEMTSITGQRPKVQKARISVAGFSLREGTPVGLTVTLRGKKMWFFLDKLVSVVLPRLRDFRGIPAKFDQAGNYTYGMSEYTVFPEIDLAKVDRARGLEITVVTNAGSPEKGKFFLSEMGLPFEK